MLTFVNCHWVGYSNINKSTMTTNLEMFPILDLGVIPKFHCLVCIIFTLLFWLSNAEVISKLSHVTIYFMLLMSILCQNGSHDFLSIFLLTQFLVLYWCIMVKCMPFKTNISSSDFLYNASSYQIFHGFKGVSNLYMSMRAHHTWCRLVYWSSSTYNLIANKRLHSKPKGTCRKFNKQFTCDVSLLVLTMPECSKSWRLPFVSLNPQA